MVKKKNTRKKKMIWNEESLVEIYERLDQLIALGQENYSADAPEYIFGQNWTDELRNKNGYFYIEGKWQRLTPVVDYWSTVKNDIRSLLKDKERLSHEVQMLKRRNYEMEYGLRVAEKALKNSLNITQESMKNDL